jgi:hypothetical protein
MKRMKRRMIKTLLYVLIALLLWLRGAVLAPLWVAVA